MSCGAIKILRLERVFGANTWRVRFDVLSARARDPKTGKMVWTRPVVEGHMGYTWDKDGNKMWGRKKAAAK